MVDENNAQDAPTDDGEKTVDWEAKYRETLAHSREWEKRAKDNKTAADELEKLRAERMSETERATARAEAAEKKLAAYEAAEKIAGWKAAAAKTTGIPADLLRGDTEESINAHAEALKKYLAENARPQAPRVANPAATPKTPRPNGNADLLKALFGNH